MLGFKRFDHAAVTISGIELVQKIQKHQFKIGALGGRSAGTHSHCDQQNPLAALCEAVAMHCSNCGKDIPFAGKVCPFCQADKSGDQTYMTVAVMVVLAFAVVGYFMNALGGALAGLAIGIIPGAILGLVVKANIEKQKRWTDQVESQGAKRAELRPAGTRPCPFCAEMIKIEAKKCRFCGEMVSK